MHKPGQKNVLYCYFFIAKKSPFAFLTINLSLRSIKNEYQGSSKNWAFTLGHPQYFKNKKLFFISSSSQFFTFLSGDTGCKQKAKNDFFLVKNEHWQF